MDKFRNASDERRLKVVADIEGHEDFQYVLADFALLAICNDVSADPVKNLHFDNGSTKFDELSSGETTTIHIYRDIPFEIIKGRIMDALSRKLIR